MFLRNVGIYLQVPHGLTSQKTSIDTSELARVVGSIDIRLVRLHVLTSHNLNHPSLSMAPVPRETDRTLC
jgi:hypothetical protein